jgi:hypothetical protein
MFSYRGARCPPFLPLPRLRLRLVGPRISSLVNRKPTLCVRTAFARQAGGKRSPTYHSLDILSPAWFDRSLSRPAYNNTDTASMTLCSTLLAAYACAKLSGTQVPMSSTPTINATLIGAAGAEYTIPIPVDMSLVYTSELSSVSNANMVVRLMLGQITSSV